MLAPDDLTKVLLKEQLRKYSGASLLKSSISDNGCHSL